MEVNKDVSEDAIWIAIEFLSNRIDDNRALYFKGTSKVQVFVKDRIGNEMLFAEDTLYNCLKIVVNTFLPQAKKDQNKSKKAKRIYEALMELRCFIIDEK